MSGPVSSSIVRPPWPCPECGHTNVWTTARCMNRKFDQTSPTYNAIPPVPPKYGLHNFGEYLRELGLDGVPPPTVVWACSYTRPCDLCDQPGRPHSGGETRCDDHPLQVANVIDRAPRGH